MLNHELTTPDATTTPSKIDFVFVDRLRYVLDSETKRLVIEVLDAAARGRAVHVRPLEDMLSTQEAADILNVSRPTLVKMLDDGLIEHERPGVHRRVHRSALEAFLAERRAHRTAALAQLADTYAPDVVESAMRPSDLDRKANDEARLELELIAKGHRAAWEVAIQLDLHHRAGVAVDSLPDAGAGVRVLAGGALDPCPDLVDAPIRASVIEDRRTRGEGGACVGMPAAVVGIEVAEHRRGQRRGVVFGEDVDHRVLLNVVTSVLEPT